MELQGGQLIAALLKADQNCGLWFDLGAVFAGSCVEAGHWHITNMIAPRLVSPKLQVQRNSSQDPVQLGYPASNREKLGVHFHWKQPLHFQRARGSWKGNTWHLTLER